MLNHVWRQYATARAVGPQQLSTKRSTPAVGFSRADRDSSKKVPCLPRPPCSIAWPCTTPSGPLVKLLYAFGVETSTGGQWHAPPQRVNAGARMVSHQETEEI